MLYICCYSAAYIQCLLSSPACLVEVFQRAAPSQHSARQAAGNNTYASQSDSPDTSRRKRSHRSLPPASCQACIAYRAIPLHNQSAAHASTCQHHSARPILCPRLSLMLSRTRRLLFEGAANARMAGSLRWRGGQNGMSLASSTIPVVKGEGRWKERSRPPINIITTADFTSQRLPLHGSDTSDIGTNLVPQIIRVLSHHMAFPTSLT